MSMVTNLQDSHYIENMEKNSDTICNCCIVEAHPLSTPLIWPPHYYGHIILIPTRAHSVIFLFNPCIMATPLRWLNTIFVHTLASMIQRAQELQKMWH